MNEPFVFGIPLIARSAARDWAAVEHLFALTLGSVLAQTDQDFHVILAAHDVPAAWARVSGDARFHVMHADWPPAPPTSANDDGGRKKWLIKAAIRDRGGGLLMFLDADDWVPRVLVQVARATISPHDVGAIVTAGFALDYASLRCMRFPICGAYDGPFHEVCGSSTIGRIVPTATTPDRLDPHAVLGSHHEWEAVAVQRGLSLARLAVACLYMIGTGQNHSEAQGPFAEWRRHLARVVRAHGKLLSADLAQCFGQDLCQLHAMLESL
jgi:hypothetical protein